MKTRATFSLVGLILSTAVSVTFAGGDRGGGFGGGHGGGGGHFDGGGHFSGEAFHSGSDRSAGFRNGDSGAGSFSFGAPPVYGRAVHVGASSGNIGSTSPSPQVTGSQASVSSSDKRIASSAITASPADRAVESARDHIFASHDSTWHRDWDRRGAHYWNGHWWSWDGGSWIGLDAGFYPWDYYPYYAYDYYPSEYYPNYYADAQANWDDGSAPVRDPNVVAAQTDLAKLGYYQGPIDGSYRPATRDAITRYQADHHLAVTGTLTLQTLESLRASAPTAN